MSSPARSATAHRGRWQPPALAELQALLPGYQVETLLGCGGMGAVFKCTQRSLQRPVALKILPGELANEESPEFAARFRQEALTLAKLTHPGIVHVFDAGEAGGFLYIVMEYVDGTDLANRIRREGRLAPETVPGLLIPVCEALDYAHRNGVIHRDIKPANLLLTRAGAIKIADFGLAKHAEDAGLAGLTRTNVSIGTPDFLAPEAWTPGTPLDARADVYSLGVTLYQMLTGEVPRGLWEMPSVRVGTDPRFNAIIERALQPEPAARYPSAAAMGLDLEPLRTAPGEPPPRPHVPAGPTPAVGRPPTPEPPPVRRSRWLRLSLGALALALAALGGRPVLTRTGARPDPGPVGAARPGADPAVARGAAVREAARWLLRERAQFRLESDGREFEVRTEQDLPAGEFHIVYLWFDRWASSPPQPPPPEAEFEVLRAVTTLRFAFLRLPGLSEAAFAFLAGNPELETLVIACPDRLTDGVFRHLAGLAKLQSLAVSHSPRITGRGIAGAAWLASVREVDFLYASLDLPSLRLLTSGERLEEIKLEGTPITREGLQALLAVPRLAALDLGACPNLTEADHVELLPKFVGLRKLAVVRAAFGDAALNAVAALTNLVELRLTGTQVTDAGLAALAPLTRLGLVMLDQTAVTPAGREAFQRMHPQCRIER